MSTFHIEPFPGRPKKRDTSKDQAGAVVVFKPGVTKAQAQEALKKLRDLLDHTPQVNTFNPEWGDPVWYVP